MDRIRGFERIVPRLCPDGLGEVKKARKHWTSELASSCVPSTLKVAARVRIPLGLHCQTRCLAAGLAI